MVSVAFIRFQILQGITAAAREGRFFVGVLLVLFSFFQHHSKQQTHVNPSNFRSVRVFCSAIPCSAIAIKRKRGPFLFVSAMVLLFSPSGSAHNTAAGRQTRRTHREGAVLLCPPFQAQPAHRSTQTEQNGSVADRAPSTARDTNRHHTRCGSDTDSIDTLRTRQPSHSPAVQGSDASAYIHQDPRQAAYHTRQPPCTFCLPGSFHIRKQPATSLYIYFIYKCTSVQIYIYNSTIIHP